MKCYEKELGLKPDNTFCEMISKTIDEQMECIRENKIKKTPDFCFYEFRNNKEPFKEFKDMKKYYECLQEYPEIKKDGRYCHSLYTSDVYKNIFTKPLAIDATPAVDIDTLR